MFRAELHIATEALSDRYLGLPTALGRSTSKAFEFLPARIKGLIGTWSSETDTHAYSQRNRGIFIMALTSRLYDSYVIVAFNRGSFLVYTRWRPEEEIFNV